jgi:hypothetical protein
MMRGSGNRRCVVFYTCNYNLTYSVLGTPGVLPRTQDTDRLCRIRVPNTYQEVSCRYVIMGQEH